jgi:hypothetical protein
MKLRKVTCSVTKLKLEKTKLKKIKEVITRLLKSSIKNGWSMPKGCQSQWECRT